jgi:hypothetical protein
MTEIQAKKIFEKYNSMNNIVRCPNGRAKMRKSLDLYAKSAVNLYGIIKCSEFVEIFNSQNEEKTTSNEVYTILLPNVIKYGRYAFYKDYIVHYVILNDFDQANQLEEIQADKPRFIPKKEEFKKFGQEEYEDNNNWWNFRKFLHDIFGYEKNVSQAYIEVKNCTINNLQINKIGPIMKKHNLVFEYEKQVKRFFDLFMIAQNNTRSWCNKGHTPLEIREIKKNKFNSKPKKFEVLPPKKVGRNEPCPCGSGNKYKKCCLLINNSGSAQLSPDERKLFYETWYKLLTFINEKYNITHTEINPEYLSFHDETELYKIREKIWGKPELINEFIENGNNLSEEEIGLLKSWKKKYIKGRFVLIKYNPNYAIFMRMDKRKKPKLYAVKGMTLSISGAIHRRLPIILETVILPFKDKIIYDSFITSQSIEFSDEIRNMFNEEYNKSEKKYGIITTL